MRHYSIKRNRMSEAALAISLFALSKSNFADEATRLLLLAMAGAFLWVRWFFEPVLVWWFERKELAFMIKEMTKE